MRDERRPGGEAERSGADRVRHDVVAVGLDDFARDRAEQRRVGEVVDDAGIRFGQPQRKRVTIEVLQAFDLASS